MTNDSEENLESGGFEVDSKVTSFEEKFLFLLIEEVLEAEALESFSKDEELMDSSSGVLDRIAELDEILLKLTQSCLLLCVIG